VGRLSVRRPRLDHPRRAEDDLVGFQYVFSSPQLALAFTGAFVIISQIKINVTNAYAGSIAPGRISFHG
jgi:hypothetical protein